VGLAVSDFSSLSKTSSNLKIKLDAFTCSNNSHVLDVARPGYSEQFSQLCQHQNPNRKRGKNPGTD
jgi:hypothetical protein